MLKKQQTETQTRKFGLLTTIAMIVGIVIGSGIFFKTPQIVIATQGNVLVGALAFLVAATGIIFGGLTIAQYASRDDKIGGIISYCEMAWGSTVGYLAGWFQVIFYYPAIICVISWVASNYTFGLFNQPNLLTTGQFNPLVWVLAIVYLLIIYILNSFATNAAGKFQTIAMVIKIAALLVLSICGLVFGDPGSIVTSATQYPATSTGFFVALVAVIFAFDGWTIAPSIAHEIKNPKKNLTLSLTIAPIIITLIYLAYFLGVNAFAGSDAILAGQDPLSILATSLFGQGGMKVVYLCVIISVLGTLNGLILGYIRLPYALAIRNEIPFSQKLSQINARYDIPLYSSIFSFAMVLIWLILHWCSLDGAALYNLTMFSGLEIDNLPIVITYVFYIILYLAIIVKQEKNQAKDFLHKYLYPSLAIIGALIILYGGFSKPKFNVYLIISLIGIGAGLLIRPKKHGKVD